MHKTFLNLTRLALLICVFISCRKEKERPGTTSLTVVNAVVDSKLLASNFNAEGPIIYKAAGSDWVNYGGFKQYSSFTGMQRARFFEYPDTTDKDLPLFDLNLELPLSTVNTLFLTGTITAPESIFIQEQIPSFEAGDSTMAVRYINLSPGSSAISVNLKDHASGSEVSSLGYKQMTGFKNYPVKRSDGDYVFEFRDAVTGDLIYTVPASDLFAGNGNTWVYRSMTMVFQGAPGGTGSTAQIVTRVTHFRIN